MIRGRPGADLLLLRTIRSNYQDDEIELKIGVSYNW